jgi:hypothetical protein
MSTKKSEAERAAMKPSSLTKHYRAIGPAAIVAALMHAKKRKTTPAAAKSAA